MDTLNSTGVPLSDYCDIVASICQGKSDDFDQDGLEPSNEHLVRIPLPYYIIQTWVNF